VTLRHGSTTYQVEVENPEGVCGGVARLRVDGREVAVEEGQGAAVVLRDDGVGHRVDVRLAAKPGH